MPQWWFKITTNGWPVFVRLGQSALANDTLDRVPGGHVFGPYADAQSAYQAAETIMAADEYAMGGGK